MIKLMKYFKQTEWLQFFAIICLVVCIVAVDMQLPDYMADIMTQVGMGSSAVEILKTGGIMLGLAFASVLFSILAGFFSARISAGLCRTVREKLFDKVGSFSMQEINKFSTASLITRSTNDITQLQNTYAIGIRMVFTAPIMAIWAILKIVDKSADLSFVTCAFLITMLVVIFAIFLFVLPKFSKMQKGVDRLNLVTRENLTGLRVIRAYNAEATQTEKFEDANQNLSKINLFLNRTMALLSPFMNVIMSGLSLALVWIGASLIEQDLLNVPTLMAFTQYSSLVLISFVMLSMLFLILPRGQVSAKRVREILSSKSTIQDGSETLNPNSAGTIVFKNVHFAYPNAKQKVLQNINFEVNKGETLAIIGSTGSGKSTIINLLMRFYDTTSGCILVNGQNIKQLKLSELYSKIGYIPQKSSLFSGTVEENVSYGMLAPDAKTVKKALKISRSESFVNKLDSKTKYRVSQAGTNLSGGQRQRLSIARALAKEPEMLLFDDSFSALDFTTDKKLREALQKHCADTTKIIVAQRIGTIMEADKILVLDDGKTVGLGSHKTLMKDCEVYRELAFSQLSKEDLSK